MVFVWLLIVPMLFAFGAWLAWRLQGVRSDPVWVALEADSRLTPPSMRPEALSVVIREHATRRDLPGQSVARRPSVAGPMPVGLLCWRCRPRPARRCDACGAVLFR